MHSDATVTDLQDARCGALMARVAKGEQAALGELFTSEAPRMLAIALRILRRRELAEEAVQEAFVSIWQRAPSFDPQRGVARAWMTIIVRNKALNILRDGGRLDFLDPDELNAFGSRASDADNAFAGLADSEALKECLGRLDAPRRRSILLAYVVGFTHGEIAAELKAPVGTVKAWIRRGMIALQECLS